LSDIMQGLSISIVGLLITFTALGIFILIMIVLQRIFPPKPQKEEEENGPESVIEIYQRQDTYQADNDQAVIAAISAAISHFQTNKKSNLGANLIGGHGRWWVAGQRGRIEKGQP
jgi:sodium pump decarboxylase gamma subunit